MLLGQLTEVAVGSPAGSPMAKSLNAVLAIDCVDVAVRRPGAAANHDAPVYRRTMNADVFAPGSTLAAVKPKVAS